MSDDAIRFPSFPSMRAAHAELIDRHRQAGGSPEIIAAIADFIQRGQATGALLDSGDDRKAAQTLLNYWTTIQYRAGEEPPESTLADFDISLAPELPDSLCPYLGLDAFGESNEDLFFGRARLVAELVERLRLQTAPVSETGAVSKGWLLAVLGPSGSGKSSVVRAGVLGVLQHGALPGSADWYYFPTLVPGSNPLLNLARLTDPAEAEKTAVAYGGDGGHLAKLVKERFSGTVVLVVDQFEEAFTLCRDESLRQAFINNLLGLADAGHVLLLTMRADFESQVARAPEFQARFEEAVVRITPMGAKELRAAIEEPAKKIGLRFEAGVVEALLQDVLGEEAALPLLQFTLLKLWERRERNRVTWEAYRKLGGGRQALARAADEFFDELIHEEQVTAKRLLLKMVRPGEGLEVTSNRVRREDLYIKAEASDRIDRVLEKFLQARLLKLTKGDTEQDDQMEVAHEALVRNWPRLVGWLEEERVALRQRQRLTAATEQWEKLGRDSKAVWRGLLLQEARRYEDLSELEREFVQAGIEAEAAEAAAEAAARNTEEALNITQRRLRRILRFAGAGFAIAVVLLVLVIVFRPTISVFDADNLHIHGGEQVTLRWQSDSPFTVLRIEPEIGPLPGSSGILLVTPYESTTYSLVAENFLTRLSPGFFTAIHAIEVTVDPVLPILRFSADKDVVVVGDTVTLSWEAINTEALTLITNGALETIPPANFLGSRTFKPETETVFTLAARNRYTGPEGIVKTFVVQALLPTPTPLPPPIINRFDVFPQTIAAGETAFIEWDVSNVISVRIEPLFEELAPRGSIALQPFGTTAYKLIASNGQTEVLLIREIVVVPAPTPGGPGSPVIEFFTASASEITVGQSVTLAWSVSGVDRVTISPLGVLPSIGRLDFTPDQTTTYILAASNGQPPVVATIQVIVK